MTLQALWPKPGDFTMFRLTRAVSPYFPYHASAPRVTSSTNIGMLNQPTLSLSAVSVERL